MIEADPFFARVRRALSHDLRTPLGTISNYASILEFQVNASGDEIRTFASRIRSNAQRAAETMRELSEAISVSSQTPKIADVDVAGLLRSIIVDAQIRARLVAEVGTSRGSARTDATLLAFAWRAFLATSIHTDATHLPDVDVAVGDPDRSTVDVWIGPRQGLDVAPVDTQRFTSSISANNDKSANSGFALGLAEGLVQRRGGIMELWGTPGVASRLRIREPLSA